MFYSHIHLRKNGKFGLVWLAATKSKILNRRELCAVNVRLTCTDILNHVPGFTGARNPQEYKKQRFSLYLTAQLMYGSIVILHKQMDFLLSDLTALLRKVHPEVMPTADIDLMIMRSEPCTLESGVPEGIKDKHFYFFFGRDQDDSVVDIESLVEVWDVAHVKTIRQFPLKNEVIRPEIGSPHSVSDPKEIQILDSGRQTLQIDSMVPGEQELPALDLNNLSLLQDVTGDVSLPGLDASIIELPKETSLLNEEPLQHSRLPALEETPAVITGADAPRTPQKLKTKRPRHGSPSRRKRAEVPGESGALSVEPPPTAPAEAHVSPPAFKRPRWEEPLPLVLQTVLATPSPLRKKRPHKLLVDSTLQITRAEVQQNLLTSESTSLSLEEVMPKVPDRDFFKEPASKAPRSQLLMKFWRKNCHFGLRVQDSDSDSESFTSPLPLDLKGRAQKVADESQASIGRVRDASAQSASLGLNTSSYTALAQVTDTPNASGRATTSATSEQLEGEVPIIVEELQDKTLLPLPELEENLSPTALLNVPALEASQQGLTEPTLGAATVEEQDGQHSGTSQDVLQRVTESVRTSDDWTTFKGICNPSTATRVMAAESFYQLLNEVASGRLAVRQDEPYGDIFIWVPESFTQ